MIRPNAVALLDVCSNLKSAIALRGTKTSDNQFSRYLGKLSMIPSDRDSQTTTFVRHDVAVSMTWIERGKQSTQR